MTGSMGDGSNPTESRPCNPILVALDVPTGEDAVRLARELSPHVGGFKVGLELLTGPGPAIVGVIGRLGKPVFADAKLHDIPNTVKAAARHLGEAGARWVTAHAAGGRAMLEAAVEGLREGAGARAAGILAITVLTSLDQDALAATGVAATPGKLAAVRARLAREAGCEGVITSVRELGVISDVAPQLLRVTPGIRPVGVDSHDQARAATPAEGMERGAHYLVIGRAITGAPEPGRAALDILSGLDLPGTSPGL
ncbi:MAG: orotidine-5'-phosphate decarboxylase [bacterium]|nr:orotidine-5'-phosphate decarboxylase [bacterium]